MSRSVLRLKDHNQEQPESGGVGRSKIDRGEWPKIIERRQNGEAIAAIARDYNVTPSAISYIVKKAQADPTGYAGGADADEVEAAVAAPADASTAPDAEPDAVGAAMAADPDNGASTSTSRFGGGESPGASPARPTNGPTRDAETRANPAPQANAPATDTASGDRPPANDEVHSDLARRLVDSAVTCARAWDSGSSGDELARTAHEVRRSLAAIEIADSKRGSTKRARAPAPQPSEPEEPPAEPAEPAAAAPTGRREPGEVPVPEGRSLGTVKFYKPSKGFGFVVPDDGGGDIYLAAETVEAAGLEDLQTGDRVAIERGPGRKGEEVKSLQLLAS